MVDSNKKKKWYPVYKKKMPAPKRKGQKVRGKEKKAVKAPTPRRLKMTTVSLS